LLVIGVGFTAVFAFGAGHPVSFAELGEVRRALQDWVAANPALAPLAYMGSYAAIVALSLPIGSYMTVLGGLLFGPVMGALYAALAATAGAGLLFFAARTALGDILRRRAGPRVKRMEAGFRANAFSYLLTLRLIPLLPFWLINLVPAFFAIPWSRYVAATFLGILPATFIFAGIGHGLGAVLTDGQSPDMTVLAKPEIVLPLLGLAALSLLPLLWRKRKAAAGLFRRVSSGLSP
jgi:uncharacterized membrane protein YdjX (TVP38/TMEM64 family)